MKILVLAAHPDDEVLGCGGAIARHAAGGDEVLVALFGQGWMARADQGDEKSPREQQVCLRRASSRAASILGASGVLHHDFPDNRMDGVDLLDVIKAAEACIGDFGPDIVYTHHEGDLNIDHRIVARAVMTATRPFGAPVVPEVYAFEVLSSTEWAFGPDSACFRPTYFVGIRDFLQRKIEALSAYQTEVRSFPHPRSAEAVRALAQSRGSQCGLEAAEAFVLLRRIQG